VKIDLDDIIKKLNELINEIGIDKLSIGKFPIDLSGVADEIKNLLPLRILCWIN